jgi:hypothetical protein
VTECGYCTRLSFAEVSSGTFYVDASGNVRDTSGMRILAEISYEMFLEPSMLTLVGTLEIPLVCVSLIS